MKERERQRERDRWRVFLGVTLNHVLILFYICFCFYISFLFPRVIPQSWSFPKCRVGVWLAEAVIILVHYCREVEFGIIEGYCFKRFASSVLSGVVESLVLLFIVFFLFIGVEIIPRHIFLLHCFFLFLNLVPVVSFFFFDFLFSLSRSLLFIIFFIFICVEIIPQHIVHYFFSI